MSLTAVQFVRIIATVIFTVTDKSARNAAASVATFELIISTFYTHIWTHAWFNTTRYLSSIDTPFRCNINLFLSRLIVALTVLWKMSRNISNNCRIHPCFYLSHFCRFNSREYYKWDMLIESLVWINDLKFGVTVIVIRCITEQVGNDAMSSKCMPPP